jgi:hypothetical protein
MIVCIRKRASEMLTLRFFFVCLFHQKIYENIWRSILFFFLMAFHNIIIIYMKILSVCVCITINGADMHQ